MGEKKKEYRFIVVKGGEVYTYVTLSSAHPHEYDFVWACKNGLAKIYNVESNQVIHDKTYNQKCEG